MKLYRLIFYFVAIISSLSPMRLYAQEVENATQVKDSVIVAPDENFVRAYVVVASPGTVMYSAMGHACLRLVCDTHNLDFIYSYEGESSEDNIVRFFMGDLMMGCRAVTSQEYLKDYADEGRGVNAYELNLPIAVKQRLWQQMDNRLMEADVPYDYINRGCAISVSHWIRDAIDKDSLTFASWPEKFERTRKEMGGDSVKNEWLRLLFATITTGAAEYTDLPYEEKVTIPTELVEVLQGATAYGRRLLSKEPVVLLKQTCVVDTPFVSPLMVALILLVLAIANLYLHSKYIRWSFWTFQFVVALFITYLVVLSDLPCTEWNWLIIPFNPLPVIMWRWRKYWVYPFVAICVVWMIGLLLYPHQVVVPAHYVLVLTTMVSALELKEFSLTRWRK